MLCFKINQNKRKTERKIRNNCLFVRVVVTSKTITIATDKRFKRFEKRTSHAPVRAIEVSWAKDNEYNSPGRSSVGRKKSFSFSFDYFFIVSLIFHFIFVNSFWFCRSRKITRTINIHFCMLQYMHLTIFQHQSPSLIKTCPFKLILQLLCDDDIWLNVSFFDYDINSIRSANGWHPIEKKSMATKKTKNSVNENTGNGIRSNALHISKITIWSSSIYLKNIRQKIVS